MIAGLALVAALSASANAWPPPADKVKHFFMSAFIHSVSFSVARATGMDRGAAQVAAAATTMSVGLLKELRDARGGATGFSVADLTYDAAGALAAAALLNGTR